MVEDYHRIPKKKERKMKNETKKLDRVNTYCPNCSNEVVIKSSAGFCEDKDYNLETAPLIIIADLNYQGGGGAYKCKNCKTEIKFEVIYKVKPKPIVVKPNGFIIC